jgi:uncharacterized membrane protein YjjP (DUF1212 family)
VLNSVPTVILAFARVLYINGQSSDQILASVKRLGCTFGLQAQLALDWGKLELSLDDGAYKRVANIGAIPAGIEMERVSLAMRAVDDIAAGRVAARSAVDTIAMIARRPPASTVAFALANAAGAVALAVIFGGQHILTFALIFVSAGAGAFLRRRIGHRNSNVFIQPFCAALLAGMIGALAVRYNLSTSLRLIALCPCMVLVPGPHVLNGALDCIDGRILIGAARELYAALIIGAICAGLVLGLSLFGVSLPLEPAARAVPLWQDALAAGVAVIAYSVFFSMPLYMLPWPVAIGTAAHILRWVALNVFAAGGTTATFLACVVVGAVLTPVARQLRMPFAAIGFAAVVSMIPGVFIFRMANGMVQVASGAHPTVALVSGTIADGATAATIIVAMSLGLVLPKLLIDYALRRSVRPA